MTGFYNLSIHLFCDSRGIQTHNLLIRSQMLYSVELGSLRSLFAGAKVHTFFGTTKLFRQFFQKNYDYSLILPAASAENHAELASDDHINDDRSTNEWRDSIEGYHTALTRQHTQQITCQSHYGSHQKGGRQKQPVIVGGHQ